MSMVVVIMEILCRAFVGLLGFAVMIGALTALIVAAREAYRGGP